MSYVVGTDTGGTFTDCVAVGAEGQVVFAKALTTRHDPGEGVLEGLRLLADQVDMSLPEFLARADRLGHGSTVGTNLVVEGQGARVLLLTTAGHADALFLMRGGHARVVGVPRELVYSLHGTSLPPPLVERDRVVEIHERVDSRGDVIAPLDAGRARADIAAALADSDVESVAISLLWSFKNPAHERALAEIVEKLVPGMFVSLSCEVAPRTGEYERTAATVINALVGPASTRYLDGLASRLTQQGLSGPVLAMQSNGGVVSPSTAERSALRLIDSGPAGGLMGAASLARAWGHANVIAADMGGTSFDVGLVVQGQPVIADEQVIGQHTCLLPHLDVRSIACGGGSIARFDPSSGSLRVGPDSAGSEPGPACYGRGGREATVTDADVVLGLLRPAAFLGGRMALSEHAAREAVGRLAGQLGLGVEETAAGIIGVNNYAAATLIRQRTLEQGYDPRDFVLYAFGGAGPVHAFGFGAELGVSGIVIPLANGASTLSAYGIASSDITQYFDFECALRAPLNGNALASAVADAEARVHSALAGQGLDHSQVVLERVAMMRYAEQYMQSIAVRIPDGTLDDSAAGILAKLFDTEYSRLYGAAARALFQAVEIFNVQVRARIPLKFSQVVKPSVAASPAGSLGGRRKVFWPGQACWLDTAVHDGNRLVPGVTIDGPAVVELPHTTVPIAPGQVLRRDDRGSLLLTLS